MKIQTHRYNSAQNDCGRGFVFVLACHSSASPATLLPTITPTTIISKTKTTITITTTNSAGQLWLHWFVLALWTALNFLKRKFKAFTQLYRVMKCFITPQQTPKHQPALLAGLWSWPSWALRLEILSIQHFISLWVIGFCHSPLIVSDLMPH